jgi:hypothetical protein
MPITDGAFDAPVFWGKERGRVHTLPVGCDVAAAARILTSFKRCIMLKLLGSYALAKLLGGGIFLAILIYLLLTVLGR